MKKEPIIIIGMHRSGTSMLAKMLEEAGVFMGKKKDVHNESVFFQTLNDWLLAGLSSTWDNTYLIDSIYDEEKVLNRYISYLKLMMGNISIISYLGFWKFIKYFNLYNVSENWGWKDPRSTFTLPFWNKVFRHATIIHIRRNGIDVANSLFRRNNLTQKRTMSSFDNNNKNIYKLYRKKSQFIQSVRCNTLDGALNLWDEYMMQVYINLKEKHKIKFLDIEYEKLLMNPSEEFSIILKYCNISIEKEKFNKIISQVRADRAKAYQEKDELIDFAERKESVLSKWENIDGD